MNIFRTRTVSQLAIALAVLAFASAPSAQEQDQVTPSHVYQATQNLISEIHLLRDAMGVVDNPPEPQGDRAPVHVYAKSLEVMRKITRAQRRLGMAPGKVGQIPVKEITPKDVRGSVQAAIREIRRTKAQLVIENKITPRAFEGGKTPSLVFKALGDASFLLDDLVGRVISPSDVFTRVQHIHDELALIAAKLKVALELKPPIVEDRKRPQEVAQQVLRATLKTINLESLLGMDASGVPSMTLVRVTPAEVYEATGILLAEMARIKAHLGITLQRNERRDARNKQPTDVFPQVLLIIRNLDTLAKATAEQG